MEEVGGSGVYISADSVVDDGAEIYAPAHISGGSHICKGAKIMPFSLITGSYVGENTLVISSTLTETHVCGGCRVGPYACLRGGTYVGEGCRIGDFVEIKSSSLGKNVKAAHLAYVGDAEIGDGVNIGCGAVFCNYDGKVKSKTVIGDNVFIGANCNLIAPLTVGDGAFIAAGTTITGDLDDCDFAIGRVRPQIKPHGARGRYKS